jgi:undecaprenyl-diphosphatase
LRQAAKHFDEVVDEWSERLRGRPAADWVFYVASEAADFSVAWHLISGAMAVASPARRPHALRLAAALGAESILVNGVLKRLTRRERPPLPDDRAYEVRRPKTASFPSGHASSATLAAILLSDAMPKARPLWVSLAAVVALSRIHNRMHHGTDVAAGAVVGFMFAVVAKRMWPLR